MAAAASATVVTKEQAKLVGWTAECRAVCIDITLRGVAEQRDGMLFVIYDPLAKLISWGGDPLIPTVH